MDEQELRVFIDIVSQYFERQTGRLPEIGSPYLGEANALPIYDFTGVIGISGERQGCVYFCTTATCCANCCTSAKRMSRTTICATSSARSPTPSPAMRAAISGQTS